MFRRISIIGMVALVALTAGNLLAVFGYLQPPWQHPSHGAWSAFFTGTIIPDVAVFACAIPLIWRWTRSDR